MIGINTIAVWFVVFLVARVVIKNRRGCGITSNDDSVKCVRLVLGAQGIAIILVMEITEGEYW
jgi:hypothetical protein